MQAAIEVGSSIGGGAVILLGLIIGEPLMVCAGALVTNSVLDDALLGPNLACFFDGPFADRLSYYFLRANAQ